MQIHEVEIYKNAIDQIAKKISSTNGSILVTGASGMIGSCIVDALIQANRAYGAGYRIYALGRNKEKLTARFDYDKTVHICVQDIADPITIDGLDYIIHAASNADPYSYAKYPAETIITNVSGAKSVLDCCKEKKTRVLLTSTFEVYGKLDQDIYREEDFGLIDENQLRSSYPESKRVAELLFRAYHNEYKVDCLVARLPSVYGPTMSDHDNKAHAEFIRKGIRRENIVLKSAGLQRRTYTYVMDVVSGIFFLLFHGASGEIYNIANEKSVISIAELAKLVAEASGTQVIYDIPSETEMAAYSKPQDCILHTGKINSLGWYGRYGLNQGIQETLQTLMAAMTH